MPGREPGAGIVLDPGRLVGTGPTDCDGPEVLGLALPVNFACLRTLLLLNLWSWLLFLQLSTAR